MKNACLCALIGAGLLCFVAMLHIVVFLTVHFESRSTANMYSAICTTGNGLGWALLFYFFRALYKKQ